MADYRSFLEPLDPASLNQRITINEKSEGAQDSLGQPTITWPAKQACYARVEALQGRELEAAQQTWAEARWRVTTHYISGIDTTMRITWGSRTLEIIDAEDPNGLQERLVMTCKEFSA